MTWFWRTFFASLLLFSINPANAGGELTWRDAQIRVANCLDANKNARPNFAVAVYDNRARLLYFVAEKNAMVGAIDLAQMKAETSALFPFATDQIAEIAATVAGGAGLTDLPNITTIAGGVPIFDAESNHIGAVGVSGGLPADDKACADAISRQVN